jgi:DNA-binding SARP family transcriptional activator/tetratricopeptide (TPR) repeat protein
VGVRFTVLGPVEVLRDGGALPGLAPRHRAVLGYLLVNARRPVSAERIIDAVWGIDQPDTARSQVHAALTAIRRVLRGTDAAEVVQTTAAGYRIRLADPVVLDADEFTELVAAAGRRAPEDPAGAAAELRAALALWNGEALADVQADYVADARSLLEDRRLTAVERLAALELGRGRHDEVRDELAAQVAAHPLRERLVGHLVLALYRSGRQADALTAARGYRDLLVEQQGLDPGAEFAELEQAVRRGDALVAGLPQPVRPSPEGMPADSAATDPEAPAAQAHRWNFLPYDIPDFAGRAEELHRLLSAGTSHAEQSGHSFPSATVAAIDGMAGIGKTALAIHAAHRLADRYPDGQLFVDLRAHTAGQTPVTPGAALEVLLRQSGVPADRIPASTAERRALWRVWLAGRRVVAVLDNAADADQIRPLLPGASASVVIVTSRRRLVDLDGARALSMELLPPADAVALFGGVVGRRADAEPLAVLDVLQLCGFLPLAVRIAAARLNHRPRWTVAYLADRLRDERRRLTELSTADRGVAAAFTLSYQQLTAGQRGMFRLLGLAPGRDIDPSAAAALAGLDRFDAEDLLEELLDAHMLSQQDPGRYGFHDLLREHARATAEAEMEAGERAVARQRLRSHFLTTARAAVDVLFPYGADRLPAIVTTCEADDPAAPPPPMPTPTTPTPPPPSFTGPEASAWLDAERANLLAVGLQAADPASGGPVTAWPCAPTHTGLIAAVLRPYLDGDSHHDDAVALHTAALRAAQAVGDRHGEARARTDLGWSSWRQGDYEQAEHHSAAALELARDLGAGYEQSRAVNTLGNVAMRHRDPQRARACFDQALLIARQTGNRVGEAHVLGNLAQALEHCGLDEQAHAHFAAALALHRELGNQRGEALVLDKLGLNHRGRGEYGLADARHREAAELYRRIGNRSDEAAARNGVAETALAAGDPDRAIAEHRAALTLARDTGNRPEQARAHDGLARAHRALGEVTAARAAAEDALSCYTALSVPEAEDVRAFLAALDGGAVSGS